MTTCACRQHLNATLRGGIFSLTYFLTKYNKNPMQKAAARFTCSGLSVFSGGLLDAGHRIVLIFNGLLQHVVGDLGVQGDDGGAGLVAHHGLVHLGQGF